MIAFIIRRIIQAVFVLLLVSIFVFIAMRILPGDPIYLLVSSEEANRLSEEAIQALRAEYGLDKPMIVQYFNWLGDLFHGDLGTSIRYRTNVTKVMMERIPLTLHLGVLAFIFAHVLGIAAGLVCAVRRGTWLDTVVTVLANFGVTIPIFWLGVMMIYVFSLWLHWLPVMGYTSPFDDFWMSTRQLIMPVICLALIPLSSTTRQTRSSMLEVMHMDYIRTAWSKGLRERVIIFKHAMKNGLIPVLTLAGLHLSTIIGGQVLIETVFAIPGMGRLAVDGLFARDYLIVQSVTVVIAAGIILVNLVVDIAYGWLDPRVRLQ